MGLEREQRGGDEQLWDYLEATQHGVFRNKTGLVADMKDHRGPEVVGWSYNGGQNQKFTIKDERFFHSNLDGKVWDIADNKMVPGGKIIVCERHGAPNQQFLWRGADR